MKAHRALAAAVLAAPALASQAAELYTPGLPASSTQHLECRIVNVSPHRQPVIVEARDSRGATVGGPYHLTLDPGEASGFAMPGWHAGMYCKFTTKGLASDFRASIDVLEVTPSNTTQIVVALPAS